MKRFLLCLAFVAVLFCGCGRSESPAAERLGAALREGDAIPAGLLYDSTLADYEEGNRLTPLLIASLYARADGQLEYEGRVEEAAIYLSSGMSGEYLEVGLFLCYGSADTDAIAEMCLRRAGLVAAHTDLDASDAVILRSGRSVIFCLGTDPALAETLADRLSR